MKNTLKESFLEKHLTTFITVFVNVCLIGITWIMADNTNKANIITLRPYLLIKDNIVFSSEPDNILYLKYQVQNTGKTPAHIYGYWKYLVINDNKNDDITISYKKDDNKDEPEDKILIYPDQVRDRTEGLLNSKKVTVKNNDGRPVIIHYDKSQNMKITLGITILFRTPSGTEKLSTKNYYSFYEIEAWVNKGKIIRTNISDSDEGFFSDIKDIKSYSKTFSAPYKIIKENLKPTGITRTPTFESDIPSDSNILKSKQKFVKP